MFFTQTSLYVKDNTRTNFCEFYVILWDFIKDKYPSFLSPKFADWLTAGRPDRLTAAVVSRPVRSTDVHKTCTLASHLGQSTEWSTDCKYPTLGWGRSTDRSTVRLGTVDRAVGRPGGRPGSSNDQIFDRWRSTGPVDRQPPGLKNSPNG